MSDKITKETVKIMLEEAKSASFSLGYGQSKPVKIPFGQIAYFKVVLSTLAKNYPGQVKPIFSGESALVQYVDPEFKAPPAITAINTILSANGQNKLSREQYDAASKIIAEELSRAAAFIDEPLI